jgi:aminoglycoside 6-adenylyltransferase
MRTPDEIKKLITDKAISDSRIRAVLLNGSRANPNVAADKFQDFDVVYIVTEIGSFISDHNWTNIFR